MKLVTTIIGVLALLGGIIYLFLAITTPGNYNLAVASAPQVTQVYSEAIFKGVMSIAFFGLAGVVLMSQSVTDSLQGKKEDDE